MPEQTCELLLDGLFATVSDLQTHVIETLISRHSLQHKVDSLQLAVLSFKTSLLKILADGLRWLQSPPSSNPTTQPYLSPLFTRLQELEHKRCVLQLRNMLKGKVEKELQQLNVSACNLTPQKVHEEESRLERLAESVVRMERDLGIEEGERSYFRGNWSQQEFVSRIDDSEEEVEAIGKRSFLTSSNISIHKLNQNATQTNNLVNSLQNYIKKSLLSVCFNTIRQFSKKCTCKSSAHKQHPAQLKVVKRESSQSGSKSKLPASNNIPKEIKPAANKETIKKEQTKQNVPQSIGSTDKTPKIPKKDTPKTQPPKKTDPSKMVFHNILQETYESLSKQP